MPRFWTLAAALALVLSVGHLFAEDKAQPAKDAKEPAIEPAKEPAKEPVKDGKVEEKSGPGVDEPVGPLKNLRDKVSYAIGLNIGRNMAKDGVDIDPDMLASGIKAALVEKDQKPLLTDDQIRDVIMAFQKKMADEMANKEKVAADKNKKDGDTFLADNKKKAGVTTTASGLQYEVITEGTGKMPKATDTVRTHYKGTLLDGTVFDSSYQRGRPATFEVGGVIKGWTEALQLMKVGSKWKLTVPSDLAYGPRGAGGKIGPNAVLQFEVELLSIEE